MNDLKMNELKKELNDLKTSFKWNIFSLKYCSALFVSVYPLSYSF